MLWAQEIEAQDVINIRATLGGVQRIFEMRVVLDPGFISGVDRRFH